MPRNVHHFTTLCCVHKARQLSLGLREGCRPCHDHDAFSPHAASHQSWSPAAATKMQPSWLCPEATAHPLHVLFQLGGQLVAEHQIHLPGKAQIIHCVQQPQTIAVAELRGLQAEIQVRTWVMSAHRPRAEQPDALHLRLCRDIQDASS